MAKTDAAALGRLTRQLDALASWAAGRSPADLDLTTPRGTVGVLLERFEQSRRLASELPRSAADREIQTIVDALALAPLFPSDPPPIERTSLAAAVRTTLATLADRHPGRLVEVRVPPFGAVQIGVPGVDSVHRRGTPPNVVECDAATWLALFTGSLTWDDARAAHRVSASGAHAQLGDLVVQS